MFSFDYSIARLWRSWYFEWDLWADDVMGFEMGMI